MSPFVHMVPVLRSRLRPFVLFCLVGTVGTDRARAQSNSPGLDTTTVQTGWAVQGITEYDRSAVYEDALLHQWTQGSLKAPAPGSAVGASTPGT